MSRIKSPFVAKIEDIEQRGYGIARHEGRVIFVEETLPGEVVEAQVIKKKRSYAFAKPLRLLESSPHRVEPFCRHFDSCGGCKWQFLPYPKQLEYKQYFVKTALERIGGIVDPPIGTILGAPTDRLYRNKLEFSFSPSRWLEESEVASGESVGDRRALGFHVRGWFDRVLDIEECWLQEEPSNAIRNRVREMALERDLSFHDPRNHEGLLRSLVIRTSQTGETMVSLVVYEERPEVFALLSAVKEAFPEITSLNYIVNRRMNDSLVGLTAHPFAGADHITEVCGHLKLRIDAMSFYQTNSRQAEVLYDAVERMARLTGEEEVWDLYSGAGSIGLYLARRARSVLGIESVEAAVARARDNAEANGIGNARFEVGEVEKRLPELLFLGGAAPKAAAPKAAAAGKAAPVPRVLILDPPRGGLHPAAAKLIGETVPGPIVYVSCNPATQARDIEIMSESYELEEIQPVDMFPQTHHIESVARLVPRVRSTAGAE
ncbi:MAG: 23S rRNA (uracil(1939)-C(5))-methyltransferase RlmD [Spirochaetaceae bacterium]